MTTGETATRSDADAAIGCADKRAIAVFVISDVELVREGLAAQLARQPQLAVAGVGAPDDRSCGRLADVEAAIVDFGAAAAPAFVAQLRASAPGCRIVGIAIGKSERSFADWAAAGVCGFVDDDGGIADVVRTVIGVAEGEFCCSPRTAAAVVSGLIARPAAVRPAPLAVSAKLTGREREILFAIERGSSNKEIARSLGISDATVKNHVHHLLEKLGVTRRSQAAALLRPPSEQ